MKCIASDGYLTFREGVSLQSFSYNLISRWCDVVYLKMSMINIFLLFYETKIANIYLACKRNNILLIDMYIIKPIYWLIICSWEF